jgi:hypothetical protein
MYIYALSPFITHEWKSIQHTALHCLSQALEMEASTYIQIHRADIHIFAEVGLEAVMEESVCGMVTRGLVLSDGCFGSRG